MSDSSWTHATSIDPDPDRTSIGQVAFSSADITRRVRLITRHKRSATVMASEAIAVGLASTVAMKTKVSKDYLASKLGDILLLMTVIRRAEGW